MDKEKNIEDKLWRIFENVNKWLDFSEKKNAIVLTFIGVQLTFCKLSASNIDIWLKISLFFIGASFLLTLISFYPKTKISKWIYYVAATSDEIDQKDNLLFYGHIAKYSQKKYMDALEGYFNVKICGYKYLEDICNQIVVNSQITLIKYNIFKATALLMLVGQFLFLLPFLISH